MLEKRFDEVLKGEVLRYLKRRNEVLKGLCTEVLKGEVVKGEVLRWLKGRY